MRTIETQVYQFEELTDKAKDKARDWWRSGPDSVDLDLEFASDASQLLGISDIEVSYSGFASQGDGASFIGSYEYQAGALTQVALHFPTDTNLHAIAEALDNLKADNGKFLITRSSSRYSHSNTMSVDFDWDQGTPTEHEPSADMVEALQGILRRFADWIYSALESDYDYQMSDEQVDDTIMANEYEFTADGKRA